MPRHDTPPRAPGHARNEGVAGSSPAVGFAGTPCKRGLSVTSPPATLGAEQLGHAPTMTLNTYTHVFREHRRSEPVDVTDWILQGATASVQVMADARGY